MQQMSQNQRRITALDGLRGLSALLVLFTHLGLDIPSYYNNISFVPLRHIIRTIMNTGNISVGYFFILCGFLMVYLYETPASYKGFLAKRYMRIFTVLLCAVAISFLVTGLKLRNLAVFLACLAFIPLIFRKTYDLCTYIWKDKFWSLFLYVILLFQCAIAFIYFFVVNRMTAEHFFSFPSLITHAFSVFTNITLTFIFGDYIPMFDAAYWSLVGEIMFYLIYPFIAWFILKPLKYARSYWWGIWYVISMIVCFGVTILFKNLLTFDTAHIHFAHFFTVGMLVAFGYMYKPTWFDTWTQFIRTPAGQVVSAIFYLVPVASAFWLGGLSLPYMFIWVAYLLAPCMGLAVATTLVQRSLLEQLFSTRILQWLGAISFPLYVIHSPILKVLWDVFLIEKIQTYWLAYVIVGIALSLGAAWYIHHIIEAFYFQLSKQHKIQATHTVIAYSRIFKWILVGVTALYVTSIYLAFKKDYGMSSFVNTHNKSTVRFEQVSFQTVSLLDSPIIKGDILAADNNMGLITMRLTHVGALNRDRRIQEQEGKNTIVFSIKQKGSDSWEHTSEHVSWKIPKDKPYPFGFPSYVSSKGKWYEFQIESRYGTKNDHTVVYTTPQSFTTVYKQNKSAFIKNPLLLVQLLANKVKTAFGQWEARVILITATLFLLFVIALRRLKAPTTVGQKMAT